MGTVSVPLVGLVDYVPFLDALEIVEELIARITQLEKELDRAVDAVESLRPLSPHSDDKIEI